MAAATLTDLRRESVVVPESADQLGQDIMYDARRKFGYHRMTVAAELARKSTDLKRRLVELEIQPFVVDSVERYKRAATFVGWRYLAIVGVLLPTVFGACVASFIWATGRTPGLGTFSAQIASIIVGICTVVAFGVLLSPEGRPVARWRRDELSETAADVPLFALQTALSIHALVPDAKFFVERLMSSEEVRAVARREREALVEEARRLRAADPFLIVRYGDYEAYIEVWDEPGFESRRKV